MNLPEPFLKRMKQTLGEDFDAFLKSYEEGRYQGLRVNELKISRDDFLKLSGFSLEQVPWCGNGFYYKEEERPGRHVWHEAGMYYIQEPSAMSAAELLQAKPGERVLDLCAAPGGKSSQLASAMKGEGLLVVNEIHPARAKILSQNMERMGVRNVLVCSETPARLADRFEGFFDRILCDAPCSGEGMFRKDENAVAEWSTEHVKMCADRQFSILLEAQRMLKQRTCFDRAGAWCIPPVPLPKRKMKASSPVFWRHVRRWKPTCRRTARILRRENCPEPGDCGPIACTGKDMV